MFYINLLIVILMIYLNSFRTLNYSKIFRNMSVQDNQIVTKTKRNVSNMSNIAILLHLRMPQFPS